MPTCNELMKVCYVGYDSTCDEWRTAIDIIEMTEDNPIGDSSNIPLLMAALYSLHVQEF